MKNIILIGILIASMFVTVNAQNSFDNNDNEQVNSLFGGGEFRSSGYGGLSLKMSQVNSEMAMLIGGRGGWTINKTITIGGAGYGMVVGPNVKYPNAGGVEEEYDIVMGYGGLFLEYIHQPNDLVHFSFHTLFGAGGILVDEDGTLLNGHDNDDDKDYNPKAAFFVIEPTIAVQLNVTTFFRVTAELGYRWTNNIDMTRRYENQQVLKDFDPNGITAGICFQFGKF